MISVVIPLYNKEKSIRTTIESVLAQTFVDFELIIINDGSTDNGCHVINQINDSRILLINQDNKGVSAARNRGIQQAKSNYIALLDADDVWDSRYLSKMFFFLQEYPEASLYGCGYSFQNINSEIVMTDLGLSKFTEGYIDYFVYARNNTLFTSSSVIFQKEAFLEIGEFDTTLTRGEDIDLWIRFALNKKVAFYNKPLVIYKLDAENRAIIKASSKEKCLIWNLDRYNQYEKSNPVFKEFLDNWRLAHVHNYLTGVSTEVTEIDTLLRSISLKNKSFLWIVLKYSPKTFQPYIYRTWISIKSIIKKGS